MDRLQVEWVNELSQRIPKDDLETTARVLEELSRRLANVDDRTRMEAISR